MLVTEVATGYVSHGTTQRHCIDPNTGLLVYYNIYGNWTYHDTFGIAHVFPIITSDNSPQCGVNYGQQTGTTLDGSGYTLTADGTLVNSLTSVAGASINAPVQSGNGSGSVTDANGNQIAASYSAGTTTFTDTLGTTALQVTSGSNLVTYTYTDAGNNQRQVKVNYSTYTIETNFACSGITDYGSSTQKTGSLVSSISLPDGTSYSLTYEPTPNPVYPNAVTGRIASITLPTGGTISYAYKGSNNGIECADGSAVELWRYTPDTGSAYWDYARSLVSGKEWETKVTDPKGNLTNLYFQAASVPGSTRGPSFYETERQVYQGSAPQLLDVTTCYNNSPSSCTLGSSNSTAVGLPITQRVTLATPYYSNGSPGSGAETLETYDPTYGLPLETDQYDYGASTPTRKTVTAYDFNNSCGVTNAYVVDRSCSVTVENSSSQTMASTTFGYDGNGNLLTETLSTGGNPSTISRNFTYNTNGTVATATDFNNNKTTYNYGANSCGAFPDSVTLPLSLTTSAVWNCTGGVVASFTDTGGGTTQYGYGGGGDPFWRVTSITDPINAVTNITYSPNSVESTLNFNGTTSTSDTLTTLDGLGRPIIVQRRQGQGSGNFDSVEISYDGLGRRSKVSVPYVGSAGAGYMGSSFATFGYDALNRLLSAADAGGGTLSYTYTSNDVYRSIGPVPSNETNSKRVQFEYDALGRLTSVCEITSLAGSGSCAQISAQTGFWTKYTYNVLDDLLTVSQSAQSLAPQSRNFTYDSLGRLISETNTESGMETYIYDSDSTCAPTNGMGNLVRKVDAMNPADVICFSYDALDRLNSITYPSGSYASVTPSKTFVYDSAIVNSLSMSNAGGRLAEAYTGSSKTTDVGFSYNARGDLTDVYEATPHSGGYYHASATRWANGLINTLAFQNGSGSVSYIPQITYGADGEGRVSAVSAASGQNPVTSTSYSFTNMTVNLGSGDSDSFNYDLDTGRMTGYTFNVNSRAVSGGLTWNSNGSLNQLAIADNYNSADVQTCTYGTSNTPGYDDLARLLNVTCMNPDSEVET